jgi:N-acetylmuramoyl-L-alanine amidase
VFWLVLGLAVFFLSVDSASGATKKVTALRHFSTEGYTRVVLHLNRESINFRDGMLKNPPRVFVDIPSGQLISGFKMPSFSSTSLARKLRVGRPSKNTIRLVVELRNPNIHHRVFSLSSPNRIVIDLRETRVKRAKTPSLQTPKPSRRQRPALSEKKSNTRATAPLKEKSTSSVEKRRSLDMTARFQVGLGRIVLDPGHGGKDPGATGLYGLVEKNLTLDISRKIAATLRKHLPPGNKVILTRNRDRFIELAKRTSFANQQDADIFISIHINSSPAGKTRGLETYLLAEASTPRALELAARESGTTVARMSDLQKILNDLMLRSKVTESHQLAMDVQGKTLSTLRRRYANAKDLGVKRGPFYVLVGAQMPSILIEMGFVTNRVEARRLRAQKFRLLLSKGVARGILKFAGIPTHRLK